jgi:hypothetical protein
MAHSECQIIVYYVDEGPFCWAAAGDYAAARRELERWVYAKGKSSLVRTVKRLVLGDLKLAILLHLGKLKLNPDS